MQRNPSICHVSIAWAWAERSCSLLIVTLFVLWTVTDSYYRLRYKMVVGIRVSVLFFSALIVKSEIYLHNTNDGLKVEFYDCVILQSSLVYCRRPREAIDVFRNNDNQSCHDNGGKRHRFSDLWSKNISVSTIRHQWKSIILEQVEEYSRYLTDSSESDGDLCECLRSSSFGKNCEYRLPYGETFDKTTQLATDQTQAESIESSALWRCCLL